MVFLGATNGVRTAMAPTMRELRRAFGDSIFAGTVTPGTLERRPLVGAAATAGDLTGPARRLYDTMRSALARGDWRRFGAAFDSLGQLLRQPPP